MNLYVMTKITECHGKGFCGRLKMLDQYNINYEFASAHCNLSTFRYKEFITTVWS